MKIIDDYLSQITLEEEFHDNSAVTYKRKISVFFEFLESRGIQQNNKRELEFIDASQILESVQYYVSKYNVNYKTTVNCYKAVIIDFFSFLASTHSIRNNLFDSRTNLDRLSKEIEKLLIILKLKDTKQKDVITEYSFNKILKECNARIDIPDINEIKNSSQEYTKFTSSIITKLVLLTGIKNKVISNLELDNAIFDKGTIKINEFDIKLPNKYVTQLIKYIELREHVIQNRKGHNKLFVQMNGRTIGTNNTLMYATLKYIFGRKVGESVAKFMIVEMIKKGVNIDLIKRITGFGMPSCMHCQEIANDSRSLEDINKELNSSINCIHYAISTSDSDCIL